CSRREQEQGQRWATCGAGAHCRMRGQPIYSVNPGQNEAKVTRSGRYTCFSVPKTRPKTAIFFSLHCGSGKSNLVGNFDRGSSGIVWSQHRNGMPVGVVCALRRRPIDRNRGSRFGNIKECDSQVREPWFVSALLWRQRQGRGAL